MINKNSILIFDGNCGICSYLALKIRKYIAKYSISPANSSYELFKQYNIDPNLSIKTVILINKHNNDLVILTESAAIFEILADLLNLDKNERKFLFSDKLIKFFQPLYRIIANNRTAISKLFGLNACKIN